MSDPILNGGKLPVALLRQLLARPGPAPDEVLLPPAVGEDAAAISIKGGALIAAADPVTLTGKEVGGHSAIINANDVAVMGVRPRWFLAVVLLPPGTRQSEVRALFDDMYAALDELGATLVGGHTEVTPAINRPLVVGQMLGFDEDGRFLRSSGMRPGDAVLQIGLAPVEGAAVLAHEASARLGGLPESLRKQASGALREPGISVVEPALAAARLGATAMHDPTEGGLSAGLYELAEASGVSLRVDADAVLWFEPGRAICAALGADPWGTLASGAVLASFPEDGAGKARSALVEQGYPAAEIARAGNGRGVRTGDGKTLPRYQQDEVSRVLAAGAIFR